MERSPNFIYCVRSILILACTLFVACGGAGVADLASTGGGQGGTGVSAGSVTAIGSVHVNGVRYDTSQAEIFVEGQSRGFGDPAVLANLAVGMVVRVEGDIEDSENGTADRVYFNDDLRGPVAMGSFQQIDPITAQFDVLGKTVIVNELTNVIGVGIDPNLQGDWVQVSGFEDAEGNLQATFVTGSNINDGANLKGKITAVGAGQITINGIRIDTLGANLIGIGQLAVDQLVEVTGIYSPGPVTIDADTIARVDFLGTANIDFIELEGIIAEKTSNTQFVLNGVPVVLDAQTVYSGGDPDDVAEDVRVEVEGQLINGTLYAEHMIFLSFAKVEADVASIDAGQGEITLRGLTDITARYNDLTMVTGAVTATDDIDNTLHVKIIGRKLAPVGTMLALHIITLGTLDNKVILQGALESDPPLNQTTITLLDHEVDISGVPDGSFESPGGTGYVAFYTSTRAGDIVSANGTRSGDDVAWQSISVE